MQSDDTLHFRAEGKHGRGAGIFTIALYEVVLAAGEPGLTVEEIHDRLKNEPAFRTDTAAWWQPKAATGDTFDVDAAGRKRVRERVRGMAQRGELISDGRTGRGQLAHYTAGRAPRTYRPKRQRTTQPGWHPVDVEAAQRAAARQRDIIIFVMAAKVELNKQPSTRSRQLLAEAVRLLS